MKFRNLRSDEIDCRISICNEYGVGLLLYKDARCDMNILDETVGAMNWQRRHTRDNANCIVSIFDSDKKQWVEKEDTGTESYTEKEKGIASDSFKRACFNWGIGRELYTAPNMFVLKKDLKKHSEYNGKWTCKDFFKVEEIEYNGDSICYVKVLDETSSKYIEFGTPAHIKKKQEKTEKTLISETKVRALMSRCEKDGISQSTILKLYKVKNLYDLSEKQYSNINKYWDEIVTRI